MTQATKDKIAAALRGIPRPQSVKDKVRASMMGHVVSDETRARMVAAHTARWAKAREAKGVTV